MPKIERNPGPSVVSTPKAQAVTRTPTPNETWAAAPKGLVAEYAGKAAPSKDLVPKQQQVTRSADPSSLWGETAKPQALDVEAFQKLSPAEQKKQLQALRAERNQLSQEIAQRLEQLDVKWGRSRLVTRTEALREYQENTKHLEPGAKAELDALLDRSESSQRKINALRARIDRLPKTPEEKAAMKELRTELARELRRLRSEQSKVVKEATAVVDEQGLKTDRLAVTEQIIDPSAPAPGSGQSLLEKVARFFELDWFFNALQPMQSAAQSFTRDVEERGARIDEELVQKRGQQLQRQRDDAERRTAPRR
jgi:hypothetical protein